MDGCKEVILFFVLIVLETQKGIRLSTSWNIITSHDVICNYLIPKYLLTFFRFLNQKKNSSSSLSSLSLSSSSFKIWIISHITVSQFLCLRISEGFKQVIKGYQTRYRLFIDRYRKIVEYQVLGHIKSGEYI